MKDDIDEDAEQPEEGEDDLKLSALNEEARVLTMVNGNWKEEDDSFKSKRNP